MDEKIKTSPHCFPAKEKCNMKKALFDWPIVLQYEVKARYRLISRKFFEHELFHPNIRLTNQKPHSFVSVQQTNQIKSNRSISIRLLFLFCLHVFISRSYENHSNCTSQ